MSEELQIQEIDFESELKKMTYKCKNMENQMVKDKALYEQKIELMNLQIQESNQREQNLRKMNENIMSALNDLTNDNMQSQNRITKELTLNVDNHQKEINLIHAQYKEQIKILEQKKKELEMITKDYDEKTYDQRIFYEKEKMGFESKIQELEIKLDQMSQNIQKNAEENQVIIKNISEKNATLLKEKDGHIEKLLSSQNEELELSKKQYEWQIQEMRKLYENGRSCSKTACKKEEIKDQQQFKNQINQLQRDHQIKQNDLEKENNQLIQQRDQIYLEAQNLEKQNQNLHFELQQANIFINESDQKLRQNENQLIKFQSLQRENLKLCNEIHKLKQKNIYKWRVINITRNQIEQLEICEKKQQILLNKYEKQLEDVIKERDQIKNNQKLTIDQLDDSFEQDISSHQKDINKLNVLNFSSISQNTKKNEKLQRSFNQVSVFEAKDDLHFEKKMILQRLKAVEDQLKDTENRNNNLEKDKLKLLNEYDHIINELNYSKIINQQSEELKSNSECALKNEIKFLISKLLKAKGKLNEEKSKNELSLSQNKAQYLMMSNKQNQKVQQENNQDILNSILNSSSLSGLSKINKENIPLRSQTPDIYKKNIKSSQERDQIIHSQQFYAKPIKGLKY